MDVEPIRMPWRLGRRGDRVLDLTLTGVLVLPVLALAAAGGDPWWTVLGLGQVLPLAWRRSHPVLVFVVVASVCVAQALVTDSPEWGDLAMPIATYSVARHAGATAGLLALAVGAVGAGVASLDWLTGFEVTLTRGTFASYFVPILGIEVTAWALGTLARTRRAYVDTLVERGERIEREAAQQVALAASDERARIAREMHDVVAHGLTVVVVQADGARYAGEREPRLALDALERIADTGRQALTDMRALLGLLRSDDAGGRNPLPGVADLRALVADSGATADLAAVEEADRRGEVPPAVALTVYRVVQEALTNVHRHAGPAADPTVTVAVEGDAVAVEVLDRGHGAAAAGDDSAPGHGLLGMRERVAVHGGRFHAAPEPGGGFAVRAVVPLHDPPAGAR